MRIDDKGRESAKPHHPGTSDGCGFLGTIGPDGFYGSGWEETLFGEYWERWRRRAGDRRHRREERR